jgi:hypothetical protein
MPLTAEERRDRARAAANERWHPGATPQDLAAIEAARIDAHIAAIDKAGRAGTLTTEQRDVLSRLFTYGPAEEARAG